MGLEGVAIDSTGNIYITDPSDGVVWEVNNGTGGISVFAGDFQPCNAPAPGCGDGGSATNARSSPAPSSLAIDGSGNIFITRPGRQSHTRSEQRYFDLDGLPEPAPQVTREMAAWQPAAELTRPFGVAVDGLEDIYIADSKNNVVRCVLGAVGGCAAVHNQHSRRYCYFRLQAASKYSRAAGGLLAAKRYSLESNGTRRRFARQPVCRRRQRRSGAAHLDIYSAQLVVVTVAGNDAQYWWYAYCCDGKPAIQARNDNATQPGCRQPLHNLLIADVGNNRIREVANLIAKLAPRLQPRSTSAM